MFSLLCSWESLVVYFLKQVRSLQAVTTLHWRWTGEVASAIAVAEFIIITLGLSYTSLFKIIRLQLGEVAVLGANSVQGHSQKAK